MRATVEINLDGTGIDYVDKRGYDALRDYFCDAMLGLTVTLEQAGLDAEVKYAEDGDPEWTHL